MTVNDSYLDLGIYYFSTNAYIYDIYFDNIKMSSSNK
jgi:hypothetical protein